jgi:hypothetical protein
MKTTLSKYGRLFFSLGEQASPAAPGSVASAVKCWRCRWWKIVARLGRKDRCSALLSGQQIKIKMAHQIEE